MTDSNSNYSDLPQGWKLTKIGEVCTKPQYGYTTKAAQEGNIHLLRTTDITSGQINWNTVPFCLENPSYPEKYILKDGDIVISRAGSIGCSYLIKNPKYSVFASYLIRFQCKEIIDQKFFKLFLKSPLYWQSISEKKLGIAVLNINATKLQDIDIPLPPLPEQHRIVEKIEELFSELDNGVASLKKALEQLKTYRQAVLKWAFEGKLTEKWRNTHQDSLEDGDTLLEQIKAERKRHYQQQLEDWKQALKEWENNGKETKKPTKPQQPKDLPPLTKEELGNLPSLPNGWMWTNFCNVTYKIGDIDHKMPRDYPNGYPYLSTGNLQQDGIIDFENAKTISPEDFDRLSLKIQPQRGDIIFPRYGTIGRNFLVNFDKKFLVSYSCAIIKNITKIMNEKFVFYYSLSPYIKKEIKRYVKETTQANIGIASIESFVFPLCSELEQTQIVQEIESRLSVCDQLEATLTENLNKAEALRQSILKRAFEGKLVL
ncbi:HsdS protein [Microcystis aeruginosa PCC 9432]|jgi:type I restriction enzyme S subunit|uniref:HsdS protein n=1 Tax=Microcystis aeruginosa PCC 9432 TaxID=1160280 RepID=A0A830ZW46_MICAE|nr:restriction endonuclease subunit S [Microcystis aeruginosa]TRT95122.1 MAG: restriction endonuclease subunit S [Microcystis aeruginosa Ma_OC_LR_19540900_S633]TYT73064.1 restriction endonuclease subunit S [Microcystis aeruginosa KLA2]CCH94786.1 HsdS protein [Microcystis aeruginosa PCC 9432]